MDNTNSQTGPISLRSVNALVGSEIQIDADTGVIRNVSIMTAGEAKGHGFTIDAVMLGQIAEQIGAGVPMRFGHPIQPGALGGIIPVESLGTDIGTVLNARVDGDRVRGDIKFGSYSTSVPGLGDVRGYLLNLAREDPTRFGLSAVFLPVKSADGAMRSRGVLAVDAVGDPGANDAGLLSTHPTPNAAGASLAAQPQQEVSTMDTPNTATAQPANTEVAPVPAVQLSAPVAAAAEQSDVIALESKRIADLTALARLYKLDDAFLQSQIAAGATLETAKDAALKALATANTPVQSIKVGEDQSVAMLRSALPQALMLKMGQQRFYKFGEDGRLMRDGMGKLIPENPHEQAYRLSSLRMRDLVRTHLSTYGVGRDQVQYLSDDKLTRAFNWRGVSSLFGGIALAQGADDFDNVLANVQNKALRIAYAEAIPTWSLWAGRRTVADFKTITDTQISDVPDLVAKDEHGRYRRVQISDSKETWTLREYGHIVAITRRAIINDDLGAFASIPMKEAAAARRLEEATVYGVLTANANMADTGALFNATAVTSAGGHANLDSATGYATSISVTTLGQGRTKMRLQKAPKGAVLNLVPRYLIVPATQESLAYQYTSVAYVAAVQTSINPFTAGGPTPLTPVVCAILDATSTSAWYMAADPAQIDTVKIAFLESEPEPVLEQDVDFRSDDVEYKVRHSVAAAALDFRGLYKNNGTV